MLRKRKYNLAICDTPNDTVTRVEEAKRTKYNPACEFSNGTTDTASAAASYSIPDDMAEEAGLTMPLTSK